MAKQRWCWVGLAFTVLFGLATIVAYFLVAGVVDAQPSTQPYAGWVAVLQHSDEAMPEQVELRVEALEPGAPGDRPALEYTVLACGDRPFHGVLLIGGQARLDRAEVTGQRGTSSVTTNKGDQLQLEYLSNVTVGQGREFWDFGAVQLLRIAIDPLAPCVSASWDEGLQLGTGNMVTGEARAPVQRTAAFLGLRGPRSSQVWPLVGGLPGVTAGNLGEFQGIRGLPGTWIVPPGLHKRVSVGSLAARATVDGAVPPLADTSRLIWNSDRPLQPTLRLTDVDAMAAAQRRLVVAGIFLGIGGSLLASLLFELICPKRSVARSPVDTRSIDTARQPAIPSLNKQKQPASPAGAVFTVGIVVIAYLLGRSRRQ